MPRVMDRMDQTPGALSQIAAQVWRYSIANSSQRDFLAKFPAYRGHPDAGETARHDVLESV